MSDYQIKYECPKCNHSFPLGTSYASIWPCPNCGNGEKMNAQFAINSKAYKASLSNGGKYTISKEKEINNE